MERVITSQKSMVKTLAMVLILIALGFVMITIVYGIDSLMPGVHDAYHDFRHVNGFPCH